MVGAGHMNDPPRHKDMNTREIKFRAWDRKHPQMFPVDKLEWHMGDNSRLEWIVGHDDWDNDGGWTVRGGPDNGFANGPRYILMQFTGLKDKNGKEIYEGDILKHNQGNYAIEFIAGAFSYDENNELEVIGNIYENPDLLK